jgi:hypothetical protein
VTTFCVDRLLEDAAIEVIPRSVLESLCPGSHRTRESTPKSLRSDLIGYILQAADRGSSSANDFYGRADSANHDPNDAQIKSSFGYSSPIPGPSLLCASRHNGLWRGSHSFRDSPAYSSLLLADGVH